MPSADFLSVDLPGVAAAAAAAATLLVIVVAHALYFAFGRRTTGQQDIALDDLTNLAGRGPADLGGMTVVHGVRQQFDAATRSATLTVMALPEFHSPASSGTPRRLRGPQLFHDVEVRQTLICDDDLKIRDTVTFFHPLKVAGDLIVEGHAIFLQPVVVNGVLRVVGTAHFARGLVAKGEAMIEGALVVGSDCEPGWAVVRQLGLEDRLKLHGTLVAGRAVEFRKAA